MARRGFLSRFGNFLRNLGGGFRAQPPPMPPETPTPTPTPRPRQRRPLDPFGRIWSEETLTRPGTRRYNAHRELFNNIPGMSRETPEEQQRLWRSYTQNMTNRGRYAFQDTRNPFWDDINMRPQNFNWREWRKWIDTPR